MNSSLAGGRLFLRISKLSSGSTRYSLPFSPSLLFRTHLLRTEAEARDVVAFRLPKERFIATDYIKRIVGLPGDRIQMTTGHLHINNEPAKRERIDDFVDTGLTAGAAARVKRWRLTLPPLNGVSCEVLDLVDNGFYRPHAAV